MPSSRPSLSSSTYSEREQKQVCNGKRNKSTQVSGRFARGITPESVSSANYNAANQQLAFGSQTLSYDLNGNLTSDGTNSYTWDARNRLISMGGPGLNASFQYDALGRRITKAVNGTSTSFLYDWLNPVQEQSTELGNTNILNGGLDEVFTRVNSNGTWGFLADALGSTIELTDSTGVIQSEYSYGAFGETASTGSADNSSQYTGRNDDGVGLYYYRARYYAPKLQRFISNDPIGFRSGDVNLYAYVGNSPLNFVDPSGLDGTNPTQPSSTPPTTGKIVRDWLLTLWHSGIPFRLGAGQSTTMPAPGAGEMVGVLQLGPDLYRTGKIVQERNAKIDEALRCAQGQGCGPDNSGAPTPSPNPNHPEGGIPAPLNSNADSPYNPAPGGPGNYGPGSNSPGAPGDPNAPSLACRKC